MSPTRNLLLHYQVYIPNGPGVNRLEVKMACDIGTCSADLDAKKTIRLLPKFLLGTLGRAFHQAVHHRIITITSSSLGAWRWESNLSSADSWTLHPELSSAVNSKNWISDRPCQSYPPIWYSTKCEAHDSTCSKSNYRRFVEVKPTQLTGSSLERLNSRNIKTAVVKWRQFQYVPIWTFLRLQENEPPVPQVSSCAYWSSHFTSNLCSPQI